MPTVIVSFTNFILFYLKILIASFLFEYASALPTYLNPLKMASNVVFIGSYVDCLFFIIIILYSGFVIAC